MLVSVVAGEGAEGVRKSRALDLDLKFKQASANEEGLCARVFVGVFFRVGAEVFCFLFLGERGEPAGSDGALCSHVWVVCEQRPL